MTIDVSPGTGGGLAAMIVRRGKSLVSEVPLWQEGWHSPSLVWFKILSAPLSTSPCWHCYIPQALSLASSQPLELSYFCWFLVREHDDLTDSPHKLATVLLAIFFSIAYFISLTVPSPSQNWPALLGHPDIRSSSTPPTMS